MSRLLRCSPLCSAVCSRRQSSGSCSSIWEEMTCMGFAQARLQAQRGMLFAVVITAVLFALQHLPLFVQNGLVNVAGLVFLAAFITLSIPFRALTRWLYNRTGSVFLVGLLHA